MIRLYLDTILSENDVYSSTLSTDIPLNKARFSMLNFLKSKPCYVEFLGSSYINKN